MDIMGKYRNVPAGKKDNTMEAIMAYEECYMKLLRNYRPDIEWLLDTQKRLRDDGRIFGGNCGILKRQWKKTRFCQEK